MANKINFNEYNFTQEAGTIEGVLMHKHYGKKNNIVAYVDLDDGRKIIAVAYKEPENYLGLNHISENTKVKLTFIERDSGKIYLSEVNTIA